MVLTNFTADDFKRGSKSVRNMVRSKRDRLQGPEETTEPQIAPDASPDDVPQGTVPEVMTWVDGDPVRAQKALDEELKNERPRKGLVSSLTEIVEGEDSVDESTDDDSDE